eukprot:TRINITY_DN92426_c0_g1_i1.p1 TRINITY_DN92426_c0_g1~~TRINITY_DN92426_c0_g1_i1.p1  ORF type:complete len:318 (-),score=64.34 TRINITY_DN92426_c0_g1_i1:205-1158(-)
MALPGLHESPLDWPGAAPAKFTDRFTGKPLQRRIVPTECRNGASTSLARQGFVNYFDDKAGLQSCESRKLFEPVTSDVQQWKPSRRPLSEPGAHSYEKREGLKVVEQPPPKIVGIRERRHIRQAQSKEEYSDRPQGPRVVRMDDCYRAADKIAQEIDITSELQRKNRNLDLINQRNGIACRALGDKSYRHPEYIPKFFHAGGLIVGATFQRGSYPKTEARNATNIKIEERTAGPMKSYKEKQAELQMAEAVSEVAGLTPAGNLGPEDADTCWESYALKPCESANYDDADDTDEEERGQIMNDTRKWAGIRAAVVPLV